VYGAGLRPHDQRSCYNTHSWSGVLPLALITVGLRLDLTALTLQLRRFALTCVGVEYMAARSLSRARLPFFLSRDCMVARWCLKDSGGGLIPWCVLCIFLGTGPLRVLQLTSHANCFLGIDGQGQCQGDKRAPKYGRRAAKRQAFFYQQLLLLRSMLAVVKVDPSMDAFGSQDAQPAELLVIEVEQSTDCRTEAGRVWSVDYLHSV